MPNPRTPIELEQTSRALAAAHDAQLCEVFEIDGWERRGLLQRLTRVKPSETTST